MSLDSEKERRKKFEKEVVEKEIGRLESELNAVLFGEQGFLKSIFFLL